MARILVAVDDLMLASRVTEPLRRRGHEVELRSPVEGRIEDPGEARLIVCDLNITDPDAIMAPGLPVIGFYSHLDLETGDRARRAGLDLVIPRSRMARELATLVDRLLAPA